MEKLNAIREKVYAATGVPEGSIVYGRPVMLHDVLRAVGRTREMSVMENGALYWKPEGSSGRDVWSRTTWNLALSLDEQEPEVIEFLHKILCV